MSGGPIDLGGLTKPATVLIERISDAVGGIAKPWQIKRVARAEAKAEIIHAQARMEISELERRAIRRLVAEEGQKQENIENISYGAILHLSETANPDDLSRDWLSHFFERSRLTSDQDMQEIWSKILAGEANVGGSFSRKTVDLVATLNRDDAEILNRLFNNVVFFQDFDEDDNPLDEFTDCCVIIPSFAASRNGIVWTFEDLSHLEDLGFIHFDPHNVFNINDIPGTIEFIYGKRHCFINRTSLGDVDLGHALLTRAGKEMAHVFRSAGQEEILTKMIKYWMKEGYSVGSIIERI